MSTAPTNTPAVGKKVALLFGLNYVRTPESRLNGCINDIRDTAELLKTKFGFSEVNAFDDETCYANTTLVGLVRNLHSLALRSWTENISVAWIHYSGHGTYVRDTSKDELDGRDECLCPSDYMTAGFLRDDEIAIVLSRFNPKTRVVFIVDACHSGTMGDLKFKWTSRTSKTTENPRAIIKAPILMVSGCRDTQTSADAQLYDPAVGVVRAQGAMTACLLRALREQDGAECADAFALVDKVRLYLQQGGFPQYPELTTSYDIGPDPKFL